MKAIGVVRKVDELGRIVIPGGTRRKIWTLRLKTHWKYIQKIIV